MTATENGIRARLQRHFSDLKEVRFEPTGDGSLFRAWLVFGIQQPDDLRGWATGIAEEVETALPGALVDEIGFRGVTPETEPYAPRVRLRLNAALLEDEDE